MNSNTEVLIRTLLLPAVLGILPILLSAQLLIPGQIEDAVLYVGYRGTIKKSGRIKAFSLAAPTEKRITYTPTILNPGLPFCWQKVGDEIVVPYGYGRLPTNGKALIHNFHLEKRDSLTAVNDRSRIIDSLILIYGDSSKAIAWLGLQKIKATNYQWFRPLFDLYEEMYFDSGLRPGARLISFDCTVDKNGKFTFFVRSKGKFEIWDFDYMNTFDEREEEWKSIRRYQPQRITYFERSGVPDTTYFLPEVDRPVFDTLFFDGHFKVFRQADQYYLLNLKNGAIYFLAARAVSLIGRLRVEAYPDWVLTQPLVIEDRDRQEIVLFQEVEWLSTDHPLPKVRIYSQKEKVPPYFYLMK
ncbi:MAG: hypothetical protein R2824_08090 [Saprospiraceae bacterium]